MSSFLGVFAPIYSWLHMLKTRGLMSILKPSCCQLFVDMFARPSVGLIENSKLVRPQICYLSFAVMFSGMCHLLCPLAEDYISLVFYAIFLDLGFGSVSGILFETLMDLLVLKDFLVLWDSSHLWSDVQFFFSLLLLINYWMKPRI